MLLLLLMVQDFCKFGFSVITDTARDEIVDIHRVEKYFNQTGWYAALDKFYKHLSKGESSVICERCLRWCHLFCANLVSSFLQ